MANQDLPPPATLRVLPNPYGARDHALDHHGRPAGAVQYEPDLVHGDVGLRYVGAARTAHETRAPKIGPKGMVLSPAEHDLRWTFSTDAVVLPSSDYYHRAIRSGDLVAADLESWLACGLPADGYRDPKAVLDDAKASAIAQWRDHLGKDPERCCAHWADFHAGKPPAVPTGGGGPTPAPASATTTSAAPPASPKTTQPSGPTGPAPAST